MKILQINSVCGIGSTGRIVTDLYHVAVNQGYKCKVAYGREKPKNIPLDDTLKIGTEFDVKFHGLMTRFMDRTGFYSTKATKDFIKKIAEYNPDIVHLHNVHGYYINIELLFYYLKKTNIPVIWTLHDCWAFTGHCAYFDYVGCDKWKFGCENCPQKNQYPKSIMLDHSLINYKKKQELFTGLKNITIVTPSNWLASLVKQSFLKKYDVQVIPNGIDLSVFKPIVNNFREQYHLSNKFIVLGVANIWDKRKGLDIFIKLSKNLNENYQIVLIGLTEKQISKLPNNILAFAHTNNIIELAEIYSAADVFVNPTLEDNFPTTNIEALACGTPVITYNTGGSVESINEFCGMIVDKNYEAILNAILKCSNNNFNWEKCVERAKKYDKDGNFLEYLNLYNLK